MGSDLGSLLQDADRNLPAALLGQLAQADGRGKSGRAGADDDHIVFHELAFQDLSLLNHGDR